MGKLWRDYNLSVVLIILFLLTWILQTWMGWQEFVGEQAAHHQIASVFGAGGYIWSWGQSTFENWQSEFLQLFSMAVLTSIFIHKGSAESRDGQDRVEAMLKSIQMDVAELKERSE